MLDGILGRGFSSKVKSSIKHIKTRIDEIRRRRNAMQKFLKKDIADLLANGLDINAYGRAEGLLVELNLSSCYDLVEQFCGSIPRHLLVMQKQSECPEECREAVSSLMFAAARFADLPELRVLRQMFTERYGDSLDLFKNQEFVEKLASNPPTKDSKLQLMRDIAKESSIKWDSKAFEQTLSNPSATAQVRPKRHASFQERQNVVNQPQSSKDDSALKRGALDILPSGRREPTDDGFKPHGRKERQNAVNTPPSNKDDSALKRDALDILPRGRREPTDDGFKPHGREENVLKRDKEDASSLGREQLTNDGFKAFKGKHDEGGEATQKRDNWEVMSRKRHELTADSLKLHNGRKDSVRETDNLDYTSHGRIEEADDGYRLHGGRKHAVHRRIHQAGSSQGKQEHAALPYAGNALNAHTSHAGFKEKAFEEAESIKPHYTNMIPPPYVRSNDGKLSTRNATSDSKKAVQDTPVYDRDFNDRSVRIHKEPNQERHEFRPARAHGHGDENSHHRHEDDSGGDRKPKPKSVRRRDVKLPPSHEDIPNNNNEEGGEVLRSNHSDRRKGDARTGLQHALYDQPPKDEEEMMMDKLLMHYSKKPSKFEEIRVRAGLNPPPGHHNVSERNQARGVSRSNMDSVHPPVRALSLPQETAIPRDPRRGPARATSFEPGMKQAGHVHPKLPDCDNLEAQIASLRAR